MLQEFVVQYEYLKHLITILVPKWSVLATRIKTLLFMCVCISLSSCAYHLAEAFYWQRHGRHATYSSLFFINIPSLKGRESTFLSPEWQNTLGPYFMSLFQKAISWGPLCRMVVHSSSPWLFLPFAPISSVTAVGHAAWMESASA